jgi:hypothetical protein
MNATIAETAIGALLASRPVYAAIPIFLVHDTAPLRAVFTALMFLTP